MRTAGKEKSRLLEFERSGSAFWQPYQLRSRQSVMPCESVAVVKNPQETQSEAEQRQPRPGKALRGNGPGDRSTLFCHQLHAPGAQAECLSAADPEAGVIKETDREQVELVEGFDEQAGFGAAGIKESRGQSP